MPDLVYEEGGKTRLATIKPTALIGLYLSPELTGVAQEGETTLMLIMDEAAPYLGAPAGGVTQ